MAKTYRLNGRVINQLPTIEEYDIELEQWVPAKPLENTFGGVGACIRIVDTEEEAINGDPWVLYLVRE